MFQSNSHLTEEQIESIKNYSKEIKTIESFVDSVRKNPGQFISNINEEGWKNCVREAVQNSTDEMCRINSPCNYVLVEYFEKTNRCIVSDNGRALDPKDMLRVYTKANTSANYTKEPGKYTSGLHGIGVKACNSVSLRFTVYSYRLGKGYKLEFHEGKPLPEYNMKPKEIPNVDNKQGLTVDFEPDLKIMKSININCEEILNFLENLIPLLSIGGTIEFIGHKADKKTVIRKILTNEDGINTYLIRMADNPLIKPITFSYDTGEMKCDVSMTYVPNLNASANVLTFANMTPVNTQLSTPSQGFFQGIIQFFKNYMNKVYLPSFKRKMDAINSDVLVGLVGAVSAAHINVMFDGQAKNVCKNIELVDFVKQVTYDNLIKWSKENPDDLQKLCEFFKDVVTARSKLDKEKINISKKYKTTSFVDLPEKYNKAIGKDHLELLICEGDSSAAGINAGRDPHFQAVFPIRGKMPNAFSTPKEKFLQNAEVQAILAILDAGYGKNFDIEKCKFEKVIAFADADPDSVSCRLRQDNKLLRV